MQDPSTYTLMNPQFQEQEHLKCPRCDSSNTKFCYYNNYNLSQPRHFCKNCRRYWTKGGTLRNIPVGGGTRKNTKRSSNPKHPKPSSSSSSSLSSPSLSTLTVTESSQPKPEPSEPMIRTSFSSLLGSNGQFGNLLLEGLNGSVQVGGFENDGSVLGSEVGLIGNLTDHEYNQRNFNGMSGSVQSGGGDSSSCWNGDDNGWPDLSIYTPGSSFQ